MAPHDLSSQMGAILRLLGGRGDAQSRGGSGRRCGALHPRQGGCGGCRVLSRQGPGRAGCAPRFCRNLPEFTLPPLTMGEDTAHTHDTGLERGVNGGVRCCHAQGRRRGGAQGGDAQLISDPWFYPQTMWIKEKVNLHRTLDV